MHVCLIVHGHEQLHIADVVAQHRARRGGAHVKLIQSGSDNDRSVAVACAAGTPTAFVCPHDTRGWWWISMTALEIEMTFVDT